MNSNSCLWWCNCEHRRSSLTTMLAYLSFAVNRVQMLRISMNFVIKLEQIHTLSRQTCRLLYKSYVIELGRLLFVIYLICSGLEFYLILWFPDRRNFSWHPHEINLTHHRSLPKPRNVMLMTTEVISAFSFSLLFSSSVSSPYSSTASSFTRTYKDYSLLPSFVFYI